MALSSSTGTLTLVLDRAGRASQEQVAHHRCPWVLIATRSQPFSSTRLTISLHRVAVSQFRFGGDAGGFELGLDLVQVGPALCDLFAAGIRAVPLGGDAGGHVEQHHAAMQDLRRAA